MFSIFLKSNKTVFRQMILYYCHTFSLKNKHIFKKHILKLKSQCNVFNTKISYFCRRRFGKLLKDLSLFTVADQLMEGVMLRSTYKQLYLFRKTLEETGQSVMAETVPVELERRNTASSGSVGGESAAHRPESERIEIGITSDGRHLPFKHCYRENFTVYNIKINFVNFIDQCIFKC